MKKILMIGILVMGLILLSSNEVLMSSPDAHTIIANPGEDARTEVNISWHMDRGIGQGKIVYTKTSDLTWEHAVTIPAVCKANTVFDNKKSKSPTDPNLIENPNIQQCTVDLKDLDVDTEYQYRVGHTNMSSIRTFKTAGAEEFSFVWISDFHAYTPIPARATTAMNMINTAIKEDPDVDFMFHTGDITAWGGSHSFWKDLYSRPVFEKYMWAGVNGNHDNMDSTNSQNTHLYFKSVNNFPKNGYGNQEGVCYYFMYNNVLFIVLNNEILGTSVTSVAVKEAQDWVAQVIENNPSQYIFVATHYEWFSGATGASRDSGYNRWKDFFDQYNVDLAMSGNNHVYTRTHSLYQDKVSTDPTKGTVYITAPSSDNERGVVMNANLTYNKEKIAYRFSEGANTVGAILVTVNGSEIKTKLLNRHGDILDTAVIPAKREAYPIESFDKEAFEASFVYSPSTLLDEAGIVSHSSRGFGYVEKIEYRNEVGSILGVNNFMKRSETFVRFEELNQVSKIHAKVTYTDQQTSEVVLYRRGKPNMNRVRLVVEDKEPYLIWDVEAEKPSNQTVAVFINKQFVSEVLASAGRYKLSSLTAEDVVEVRDGRESKATRHKTKYLFYGDVNLDGVIDLDDVKRVQRVAMGEETLDPGQKLLADVDQDGLITLIDVTYIHLSMKQSSVQLNKKVYTVRFLDHLGRYLTEEAVLAGASATSPTVTIDENLQFVGWSQDTNFVGEDMVVYMIVEPRILETLSKEEN